MKSLETVQKIFKVLHILARIAYVLCIVGLVFTVIGAIGIYSLPTDLLEQELFTEIFAAEGISAGDITETVRLAGFAVLMSIPVMIAAVINAFFVKRYLSHELEDGTPFTHRGADELKTLGIILIVAPIVATGIVLALAMANDAVSEFFTFEADITMGIVCILLSFVFRYGADVDQRYI